MRVNRPLAGPRRSYVATASVERDRGDDTELARAVHKVLATLTDVRGDTPPTELRDRIVLVRWLRNELAAAEALLTGVYGRREATSSRPFRGPVRTS